MSDLIAVLRAAGYLLYVPLIWYAGNKFCRLVLRLTTVRVVKSADDGEAQTLKAGRYIGLFERALVTIGVATRQWEIIAAVIALKTVARYQELDKQITAEYFLVGSLASLFWGLLTTYALLLYDRTAGFALFR